MSSRPRSACPLQRSGTQHTLYRAPPHPGPDTPWPPPPTMPPGPPQALLSAPGLQGGTGEDGRRPCGHGCASPAARPLRQTQARGTASWVSRRQAEGTQGAGTPGGWDAGALGPQGAGTPEGWDPWLNFISGRAGSVLKMPSLPGLPTPQCILHWQVFCGPQGRQDPTGCPIAANGQVGARPQGATEPHAHG